MPFNFTPRKKRNQVRKKSTKTIISHTLIAPIENAGNILGLRNHRSTKIKIPKTIVINVKITINLVGGVHPIFFTN